MSTNAADHDGVVAAVVAVVPDERERAAETGDANAFTGLGVVDPRIVKVGSSHRSLAHLTSARRHHHAPLPDAPAHRPEHEPPQA